MDFFLNFAEFERLEQDIEMMQYDDITEKSFLNMRTLLNFRRKIAAFVLKICPQKK